jgi:putative FmdB family regulatory protein
MPVYEYACTSCGERTEAKQRFDEAPLEECPKCGGRLRKLYSPVGIVFKGTGFYATDGRTGHEAAQKAAKKEAEKGDGGSKKETKPSSSKEKSA